MLSAPSEFFAILPSRFPAYKGLPTMAFRLKPQALEQAIKHLCRYGDTDVLPHSPELAFFRDEEAALVAELSMLDLDSYDPSSAVEALAPKSKYGFRVVHHLPVVDSVLLLASVCQIGSDIEEARVSSHYLTAFSYRFSPNTEGRIFSQTRTYRNWLESQADYIDKHPDVTTVVATDISDFYARVNYHRLENLLDQCSPGHGAARFIKKHVRTIRATQSFGLPVGGSAARLLAELVLADTDRALISNGIISTRFVDDFRFFLKEEQSPYDALGFLAEQLGINEGLSLNASKTTTYGRAEYLSKLDLSIMDISDEAEGVALESLTAELYHDEEPDEEKLRQLQGLNLLGFLQTEIDNDPWDVARIKVIFRALKIAKPEDCVSFITDNLESLLVFAKELCLLMQEVERDELFCFNPLLDRLLSAILSPPASSVQSIRTWLIEMFVREVVTLPANRISDLLALGNLLDKRQILFLRGRLKDVNFFRKNKTSFDNYSNQERFCLVWGASCLPSDEYEKWSQFVKPKFSQPTCHLFLKWAFKNRGKLTARLAKVTEDHPE